MIPLKRLFLLFSSLILLINAQGPGPGLQFEILEESPIGSFVGRIPTRAGFTYRFNEVSDEFKLNNLTGEIRSKKVIDRESLRPPYYFDLVVLSSSPTYPIELRILILDINDHSPIFPEAKISVSFSESATPGTRLFLDAPEDLDSLPNRVSTNYKILDGNQDLAFSLSSESPFLYLETVGRLDRETVPFYSLNISATDDGSPPKIGYLNIHVQILDVNDNPPIFDHSDYVVSLSENVGLGSRVLQVGATDSDSGENGRITYYFGREDSSNSQFNVDPESGLVSTNVPNLSCPKNSCVFTVFAHDSGIPRQNGRTYVTVNLIDANDHDPVIQFRYFPPTASMATVDENAGNGSVVSAISIHDPDEGPNGETQLEILTGNELKHFRLESTPSFHLLRVNSVLDREKLSKYNLTLLARDLGQPPRTSSSNLLIQVNDVNDHEPIFEQTEYRATLTESLAPGSFVASLRATDGDSGINAQLWYSIVSGNEIGWFGLEPESGLLITKDYLDREKLDVVRLKISARDGGPNPKWAYTSIKITILDENDSKPQFEQETLELQIPENQDVGTLLTVISATDPDQGTNGSVSYHLEPPSPTFHLDSNTGKLTTLSSLDRETVESYKLIVIARDQGLPESQSSKATVNILVTDVNDNDPVFYPPSYLFPISNPNVQIGQIVGRVHATDLDLGGNAELSYEIQNPKNSPFSINSKSGELSIVSNSNLKTKNIWKLDVQAKDSGDRKSKSNALVEIIFNPSKTLEFEQETYTFTLQENQLDFLIGKVQSKSSKDSISYTIQNGDPEGLFQIHGTTGQISTSSKCCVDFERQANHTLEILGRGKSGTEYGQTVVWILVQNINDVGPKFEKSSYEFTINENSPFDTEIGIVRALDPDSTDLEYSLENGDPFRIESKSGLLRLQNSEPLSPGSIQIKATVKDSGNLSSSVPITIRVKDINNYTPTFDHSAYETSVSESTPVNTRFFWLSATDLDAGPNSQLQYWINVGNEDGKFGIFPDGWVYLRKELDREEMDYYGLVVSVKDLGEEVSRSSSVGLTVHVLDENDWNPQFTNHTFTFTIDENQGPDTYVGKLLARDKDIGKNAELTYSTLSKDFLVEPKSGIIKSYRSFDREIVSQINFEVTVVDGGGLRDSALVQILIQDQNDNEPKFLEEVYRVEISEGLPLGSLVVRVGALDPDQDWNSQIIYYFQEQEPEEESPFSIEGTTGQIHVSKTLDAETQAEYKLVVIGQDLGSPEHLSSSAIVYVQILDENDNEPEFGSTQAELNISEEAPVFSKLIQFHATDPDVSELNSKITYGISGGNRNDVFRLATSSEGKGNWIGTLYLNKALDFEKISNYVLNITASDSGHPQRLSSSIQLTVKVQDSNDNPPTFPSTAIVRQIPEGLPINSVIVTLTATDPDSGLNGKIKYSLLEQEPPGNYFGIDSDEGKIYTRKPIDREFSDGWRLVVLATDQSLPLSTRLSTTKPVTIIIEDVNDNGPIWNCLRAGKLLTQSKLVPGSPIFQLNATDRDSDSNGRVNYELINGERNLFQLNRNTGLLSLAKELNGPLAPTYTLKIRATDEAPVSVRKSTDLDLTLISIPQSKTQAQQKWKFENESFKATIMENEPIGTTILRLQMTEGDGIRKSNGDVEYYITNITSAQTGAQIPNNLFDIDVRRGILTNSQELDHDSGQWSYNVEVIGIWVNRARDSILTAVTTVQIEVLDTNDSPPQFPSTKLSLNVSESGPVGLEILHLTATDRDVSGTISYSILDGDNGKFQIETGTGILRILNPLDREQVAEYSLTIQANDGAQSGETTLRIQITDENDNPPKFINPSFSFDVPEDSEDGEILGQVQATDLDSGLNGQITYSILSNWGNEHFSLNPKTGEFSLRGRLDYEEVQHYVLIVQAQDSGTPSLSSTVTLYINVVDLNDNSPSFEPLPFYNKEIPEDVTVGTSVIKIAAMDVDSGLNGLIDYTIISGNENNTFGISSNGTIFTLVPLDRESISSFYLTIQASDQGQLPVGPLSSTLQFTINVKDVNDNAPFFTSPNQTAILENSPLNTILLIIKAMDPDEGRNSYVEYILESSENLPFSLGTLDGILRVDGPLDRESVPNYKLRILARDKGEPTQSSAQSLLVSILDQNDNDPIFDPKQYSVEIPENSSLGLSVLTVSATDSDDGPNNQIRYSVVSGDPNRDFIIGEDSGILRLANTLNYEKRKAYTLEILAEDSGEEIRQDRATIFVTVLNTNDNPPIFLNSPYYACVRENLESLPAPVLTVSAWDADGLPNHQIRYLLKDGNEKGNGAPGTFKINPSTGEITVHRSLDREKQAEYALTIVAMDTGTPRLTGTGTVLVSVIDTNDNSPIFQQRKYQSEIYENTLPGSTILQVLALDSDEGENGKIKYTIVDYSPKNHLLPFSIDQETGAIKLIRDLRTFQMDRKDFNLIIEAKDSNEILAQSTRTNVTISLAQHHPTEPSFRGFKENEEYKVLLPSTILLPAETFIFSLPSANFNQTSSSSKTQLKPNNLIKFYLGGPDSDKFSIHSDSGIITTLKPLRGAPNVPLSLELHVSRESASYSVPIQVQFTEDQSDRFPKFTAQTLKSHSWKFNENTKNVLVTKLVGTSKFGSKGLKYSIRGGNVDGVFVLNSESGELWIGSKGLDFEAVSHYDLWVSVAPAQQPLFSTATLLSVNVTDENDNSPTFEKSYYELSVLEEEPSGTLIGTLQALDPDSGQNGLIEYRLLSHPDLFSVDPKSGELRTRIKLDREEVSEYTLTVEAWDQGGSPTALVGSTTVHIQVEDKNDNPPRFTRLFNVNVTENSRIGQGVVQVTSVDRDIGSNANCTYILLEEESFPFTIHPATGLISISGPLDRESQDEYHLRIAAIDGNYWRAETLVTIHIQDLNDNEPEFEQSYYNFNLLVEDAGSSNLNSKKLVGQIIATDRDRRGPNSLVTYSLKYSSNSFSLDPITGEIWTKGTVSRLTNKGNEHSLIIIGSDNGKPPLSSETTVTINLVGPNQDSPIFGQDSYFSAVLDTALAGDRIMQIQASDQNPIEYFITGGNGTTLFEIEKDLGWISLKKSTNDRLAGGAEYYLKILAKDAGIPSLESVTQVTLIITGPNHHAPTFGNNVYQVIIPENEPIGTKILTILGSDKDGPSNPNGQLRYKIIPNGNEAQKFQIHPETGCITISQSLDYESKSSYNLTILGEDLGFHSQNGSVLVRIFLTDVNDNPPIFSKSNYIGQVSENSPIHTPILQIRATDSDSSKYAQIHYSIVGGNGKSYFGINSTSGQIFTSKILNYEDQAQYTLEILVTNPDSPHLYGKTRVEVKVLGLNEFIPRFTQPLFHFTVPESAELGFRIGQVEATDEDQGSDGQILYLLLGPSSDRGFSIDKSTGVLTVSQKLDRETQARISLSVLAKNPGSIKGNDIDEAQILITIQDSNDPPEFRENFYSMEISENSKIGSEVGQVQAKDSDLRAVNNKFHYAILEPKVSLPFEIDQVTGKIRTTGPIDRETVEKYNLLIGAIDTGEPPQTGTTQVQIKILDVNDNPPVLAASSKKGSIYENEPLGTIIMNLVAEDPDVPDPKVTLKYILIGGSGRDWVHLDETTGIIRSKITFDRELTQQFTLLIQIQDSVTKTQPQEVLIEILDRNDSPSSPRSGKVLVYYLPGEKSSYKDFAHLRPKDPDITGNYNCRLVNGNAGNQLPFKLGPNCSLELLEKDENPEFKSKLGIVGDDGVHEPVNYSLSLHVVPLAFKPPYFVVRMNLNPAQVLEKVLPKIQNHFQLFGLQRSAANNQFSDLILGNSLNHQASLIEKLIGEDRDSIISTNWSPCQENPCPSTHTKSCQRRLVPIGKQSISEAEDLLISTPTFEVQAQCECQDGFLGPNCGFSNEPCSPNPCQGGGTCEIKNEGFKCQCPPGRYGTECELEQNNICHENPCQNGGECKEQGTSDYFCLCRPGFLGKQCQTLAGDPCKPNPCRNGGSCVRSVRNGGGPVTCSCPTSYYGQFCEKSAYGFAYGSWMSFGSLDPNSNDISITISTVQKDGLILWNFGESVGGRSDFLSIELVGGKPMIGFGGSRTATSALKLDRLVADGKWWMISVLRNGKVASGTISPCDENGENCKECGSNDSSCSGNIIGNTGTLSFNNNPVYIGGLSSVGPILERPGQVGSDDFVGCVHRLEINGKAMNLSNPKESYAISDTCPRVQSPCVTMKGRCGKAGECLDKWDHGMCECVPGLVAPNCWDALSPLSVRTGGWIEFLVGEKFKRTQLLRKLEEDGTNVLEFSFRTGQRTDGGTLFHSSTNKDYTLIRISNGVLEFSSKSGPNAPVNMSIEGLDLADSIWHRFSLVQRNNVLRILIDEKREGEELDSSLLHSFLDPYLTQLSLGGSYGDGGWEGCLANLSINGHFQPLNQTGTLQAQVLHYGKIVKGCGGGGGYLTNLATSAPDPLSIGVSLVIVFFIVLLIAISASFIIYRIRKAEKSSASSISKPNSNNRQNGEISNLRLHHPAEREHSMDRPLGLGGHHGHGPSKRNLGSYDPSSPLSALNYHQKQPDIIERSVGPFLNHVSLEPDLSDHHHHHPMVPEHYDLENASSIAPSDIDIVYHYKGYRENPSLPRSRHHLHPPTSSHHPTPLARLSPSSELSQQTGPRILTLQDISGKPLQSALVGSPSEPSSSRSSLLQTQTTPSSKIKSKAATPIGLTAEEVQRLNTRSRHSKNNSSLVSSISSEQDQTKRPTKVHLQPHQDPRGPRVVHQDCGSESRASSFTEGESGPDSYSCSEFEHEDEEPGDRNQQQYKKPARPTPKNCYKSSLSTLVGSEDGELGYNTKGKPNPYLLHPSTLNSNTSRGSRYPTPRPSEQYL